jgi:hypothetical protein
MLQVACAHEEPVPYLEVLHIAEAWDRAREQVVVQVKPAAQPAKGQQDQTDSTLPQPPQCEYQRDTLCSCEAYGMRPMNKGKIRQVTCSETGARMAKAAALSGFLHVRHLV